jgi:hypothetical protein
MKIYCALFLILALDIISFAAGTNVIYMTDDGNLYLEGTKDGQYVQFLNPTKIEAAKKSRESLPAEDFHEGNWGNITDGLRLSLRLVKDTYTNGEPITAILLFRNVTNSLVDTKTNVSFYAQFFPWLDGPAKFTITTQHGSIIPGQEKPLSIDETGEFLHQPRQMLQRKYFEHINSGYSVGPGRYTIQAYIPLQFVNTQTNGTVLKRWSEDIKSAPVELKVE